MIDIGPLHRPIVLVVDDELAICQSLADLLRVDYHVMATTDPREALLVLRDSPVALLITDQRMPSMSGVELLSACKQLAPGTPRILITAYSDIEAIVAAVNGGGLMNYLSKPWEPDALLRLVGQATARYRLVVEREDLLTKVGSLADAGVEDGKAADDPTGEQQLERDNTLLRAALANLNNSYWHLKKIHDVLPICMQCGQVSVSEGVWISAADFLRSKSTFLSHGYCPNCMSDEKLDELLRDL